VSLSNGFYKMTLIVISVSKLRDRIRQFKPSDVAADSGLTRQWVHGFVKGGNTNPSYYTVMALAQYLVAQGVDIQKFQKHASSGRPKTRS
jgi:hypothetical protein